MKGIRHLIQCHCVLPQYRRKDTPIFHKFTVFSVIKSNDAVEKKIVQCENCGIIHRVFDICRSEILVGKDESETVLTIEDIRHSLPDKIVHILDSYNCDVSVWEHIEFLIDNEQWGEEIVIKKETQEETTNLKILKLNGPDKIRIKTANRKDII